MGCKDCPYLKDEKLNDLLKKYVKIYKVDENDNVVKLYESMCSKQKCDGNCFGKYAFLDSVNWDGFEQYVNYREEDFKKYGIL